MERLSGLDADFIYLETPSTHMHVAATCVLDPTGAPEGRWFEAVREVLEDRLDRAPMLRRRLVEVPARLDHPRWVDDAGFDLDYHLRRICLSIPGGAGELSELAAEIMGQPLDRSRPLWEMHVVEGLEAGLVAVVIKVHHAVADGVTAVRLLARLLAPDAEPAPEAVWQPEPLPSGSQLVGDAFSGLPAQALAAARAMWRSAEVAAEVSRRNRELGVSPPPAPFRAPRTSLNATIAPRRRVGFAEVSSDDVKLVKAALRVTTNDVVLGVCSGSVRRYLAGRGEEPEEPLVVLVPVSAHRHPGRAARAGHAGRARANQVSGMLVSLATDVDDPVERVRTISRGTRQAKKQERVLGADTLDDLAELSTPLLALGATRLVSRLRVFDRARPLCNLVVSNVPGPPSALCFAGARMVAIYPMAPVADGIGLNITVVTYLGRLFFGLVACRETVPDVDLIAGYLNDALDELVEAARRA